jgi:hypothetical protein
VTPANAVRLHIHPALGCAPIELHYDFLTATGALVMADENHCDMDACVAIFTAIDSHVRAIATFSGIERDVAFTREGGEEWRAQGPGRPRKVAPG